MPRGRSDCDVPEQERSVKERLMAEAGKAREASYSPYSGFPVGAALLTKSGNIFTGCNVEGVSFGNAICAERTALVKAVSEGEREFEMLAVVSSSADFCLPCGICRQMLIEFSEDLVVLAGNDAGEYREYSLGDDLLPNAFRHISSRK